MKVTTTTKIVKNNYIIVFPGELLLTVITNVQRKKK